MTDISRIESLEEFTEELRALTDPEIEHLRRQVVIPARPVDVVAVLDRELARRHNERTAEPRLLARLDAIGQRLRQPIPERRQATPTEGSTSPAPEQPVPDQPPSDGAPARPAASNVVPFPPRPMFVGKCFPGGRSEPYWVADE